ncbi:aconitase family protein (aconitate hydratase) [Nitrospirillum amazonense]|uniref:aconitate hydratase n=1 Tax=Nitrospirillum amazonense TaxID=28077 RepID=A0A560J9A6_9PROT|nr:aconitase family protein [Nitrospirillum amazonense]TWB67771.1 aconitase family protein (aconitate hydratase) [Nitrospirillum amazonense]
MNAPYRKPQPGTALDYFDALAAVDILRSGAWAGLSYVCHVLAEQLVRRCDPAVLTDALRQLVERRRDLDFPWYPARVVCHDILGQTALVDLASLRDAIAGQGGDPAEVNPAVPTQLIVDHSLAVEYAGFDSHAFEKNRAVEDRRNEDRFHFIDWTRRASENVAVIPAGMHQINLEKMSPVILVLCKAHQRHELRQTVRGGLVVPTRTPPRTGRNGGVLTHRHPPRNRKLFLLIAMPRRERSAGFGIG